MKTRGMDYLPCLSISPFSFDSLYLSSWSIKSKKSSSCFSTLTSCLAIGLRSSILTTISSSLGSVSMWMKEANQIQSNLNTQHVCCNLNTDHRKYNYSINNLNLFKKKTFSLNLVMLFKVQMSKVKKRNICTNNDVWYKILKENNKINDMISVLQDNWQTGMLI